MNTPDSECNPSVTITMTCDEAMTLWQSLAWYDKTHRKTPRKVGTVDDGKWGHYDCPPRIRSLLLAIKDSIHSEHPELFAQYFGFNPKHYDPDTIARY